jgi:hypothetical protein
MSSCNAFIDNILTMSFIFPSAEFWATGALPSGMLVWGVAPAPVTKKEAIVFG